MSKKKIPDAQQYPTIVYKDGGIHAGPSGHTYSSLGVEDEAGLRAALDSGWFLLLAEACGLSKPEVEEDVEPAKDAPPTRAELEQKAGELGLKFDGRTSDSKLLADINAALKAKA